jgi:hypothetical protein
VPAGSGLLVNDNDPDGGALSLFSFDATSVAGGDVMVNTDGSFSYNPPPGYEGVDTFTYLVADSGTGTTETPLFMTTKLPAGTLRMAPIPVQRWKVGRS